MILIRAETKRGQLRQILLASAIANAWTVALALFNFQSSVNEINFQKGRTYSSTSGAGQHASFQMVGSGTCWTQENVFGMSEEFFEIYYAAMANTPGLADNGQPASTTAIFMAMIADDRLQTVTRRGLDATLLGFPQVGQLGGPA